MRRRSVFQCQQNQAVFICRFLLAFRLQIRYHNDNDNTFREAGSMNHAPIDRKALVTRHNIRPRDITRIIPLGNGETCFGCDRTGLQTFGGNTMAHWAWHSFPVPEGVDVSAWTETGSLNTGRLTGKGEDLVPPELAETARYMFDNPHSVNLGRLSFVHADGTPLEKAEITDSSRECHLWSGHLETTFRLGGKTVTVTGCVHPRQHAFAAKITGEAGLAIALDFPYASTAFSGAMGTYDAEEFSYTLGEFSGHDRHETLFAPAENSCRITRHMDDLHYWADLSWDNACLEITGPHGLVLRPMGETLELTLRYRQEENRLPVPTFAEILAASANAYEDYWRSGGAIDLSGSTDERWFELERKIVLSQYLMAVQSRGSWPCAEAGLMFIDMWRGQFHMEMTWWHIAHYALWSRMECADEQLTCYQTFLPMAKKLAAQLDYAGAKWGKSVGPEGRTAPWGGNLALLWKQPHPIFFAELEYLNRPTDETLHKWAEIIRETADHMADYPVKKEDGYYHLDPVVPPCELGFTYDTLFDLAYWRWALETAQTWQERMGLPRVEKWDDVAYHLPPLPVQDGAYIRSPEWTETYTRQNYEHPDPVGICGMLPPTDMVDVTIARASLKKVWATWNKNHIWGWDFPWIAMCAARVGEPELAVEAMLSCELDEVGCNCAGSYPYLPANGAILFAAAMMALGRNGEHAPGFPDDGKWVVRQENIKGW